MKPKMLATATIVMGLATVSVSRKASPTPSILLLRSTHVSNQPAGTPGSRRLHRATLPALFFPL